MLTNASISKCGERKFVSSLVLNVQLIIVSNVLRYRIELKATLGTAIFRRITVPLKRSYSPLSYIKKCRKILWEDSYQLIYFMLLYIIILYRNVSVRNIWCETETLVMNTTITIKFEYMFTSIYFKLLNQQLIPHQNVPNSIFNLSWVCISGWTCIHV